MNLKEKNDVKFLIIKKEFVYMFLNGCWQFLNCYIVKFLLNLFKR